MTLKEVKEIVNRNKHLIGRKVEGKTIDELLIYPTDLGAYNVFISLYFNSLDNEQSLKPFLKDDLDVKCVLNKSRIDLTNVISTLTINEAIEILNK